MSSWAWCTEVGSEKIRRPLCIQLRLQQDTCTMSHYLCCQVPLSNQIKGFDWWIIGSWEVKQCGVPWPKCRPWSVERPHILFEFSLSHSFSPFFRHRSPHLSTSNTILRSFACLIILSSANMHSTKWCKYKLKQQHRWLEERHNKLELPSSPVNRNGTWSCDGLFNTAQLIAKLLWLSTSARRRAARSASDCLVLDFNFVLLKRFVKSILGLGLCCCIVVRALLPNFEPIKLMQPLGPLHVCHRSPVVRLLGEL